MHRTRSNLSIWFPLIGWIDWLLINHHCTFHSQLMHTDDQIAQKDLDADLKDISETYRANQPSFCLYNVVPTLLVAADIALTVTRWVYILFYLLKYQMVHLFILNAFYTSTDSLKWLVMRLMTNDSIHSNYSNPNDSQCSYCTHRLNRLNSMWCLLLTLISIQCSFTSKSNRFTYCICWLPFSCSASWCGAAGNDVPDESGGGTYWNTLSTLSNKLLSTFPLLFSLKLAEYK